MAIDRDQLKSLIDATLSRMDLHSPAAVVLLLGTAAQESRLGTYIRQIGGGPALGIFQMEPATERDIWDNYLRGRMHTADRVWVVSGVDGPNAHQLEANLIYQIAIARIHYLRVPRPLPEPGDIAGMAAYWKQFWNTRLGAGTPDEFIANYRKYVETA